MAVLKARSAAERGVCKRFSALQLTEPASPVDLPDAVRALWRSMRRRARAEPDPQAVWVAKSVAGPGLSLEGDRPRA